MLGLSRPMQLYPDLQRDFIGKGLKRFLFWTILIVHVIFFILPSLWYLFGEWLKPEEKVISVALVDFPTDDPNAGGGGPGASTPNLEKDKPGVSDPQPELPDLKPVKGLPDVPDVPDIPTVPKVPDVSFPVPRPPRPKPQPKKNVPKTEPKNTVQKKTEKKSAKEPKKPSVEEQIRAQREAYRKNNPPRKGVQNGGTKAGGSSRAGAYKDLANELRSMQGSGGGTGGGIGTGRGRSRGSGTGGFYDPTLSELLRAIDRYWVDPQVSSNSAPDAVIIKLRVDGRGGITVLGAETTRNPAIDSAVSNVLKRLQTIRVTPPENRIAKNYEIRLRIREE